MFLLQVGEGEKLVRTLFMVAIERQPSVIFMDEVCLSYVTVHAYGLYCKLVFDLNNVLLFKFLYSGAF